MNLQFLELNNFWIPLIWVFAAGYLLNRLPKTVLRVAGQPRVRWTWGTALLLAAPLIFWAGLRSVIGDTGAYMLSFQAAPSSLAQLPEFLSTRQKDLGFYVLMTLLKAAGIRTSDNFFLVIAAAQVLLMVCCLRKYSHNYWISIFLFLASSDYISWMFNGMRQFLAVCITFAAFDLLVKNRFGYYVLVVLLASAIHGSALLMIPIGLIIRGPALNAKTLLAIVLSVAIIPFVDRLTPVLENLLADTQYDDIMSNGIWESDDGTNLIRVVVYSIPAILAFFGRPYVVNSRDPAMDMCVNAAVMTMAVYLISSVTSGIYIGRLPIYTTLHGYMALPWMIDRIFEKRSASLVKILMIACYLAFYYYQVGIKWGML